MRNEVPQLLERWTAEGVIDAETAARIRAFERERREAPGLRWPILVALAFGALMLAGGVLLFVSAHWDTLSPAQRFTLVLVLVAIFHVAGGVVGERFRAMSVALHAVGTVALGAGIFLAGQIFNLDEHWPGGVMVWALGAALAWFVLRQLPQLALTALLVPMWLASEWLVVTRYSGTWGAGGVLGCGLFTLALAYFTAPESRHADRRRRTLMWLGGVALAPASMYLALTAADLPFMSHLPPLPLTTRAVGWVVAIGGPLLIAVALRRERAWPNAIAAVWAASMFALHQVTGEVGLHLWWALGAVGLVAWGVTEARHERINMGMAMFAATVVWFYFSEVVDKLGRSASLIALGLLFLGGGWALERFRRRLVEEARSRS